MDLFLWSCLGAAFPEIVRQWDLRDQGSGVPFSYYVRSFLFIIGSGLVVLALNAATNPANAMYAGAAAPVLFNAGARKFLEKRQKSIDSSDPQSGAPLDVNGPDEVTANEDRNRYVRIDGTRFERWNGWTRFILSL